MSYARPVVRSNRRYDIPAAAGQTVFTFPALLYDTADLAVSQRVAPSPLFQPLTDGFVVALSADLSQGTVTFAAAPFAGGTAAAVTIRLEGRRVQERLFDVTRGGVVRSASLEDELDCESLILQEVRRDVDDAVANAAQVLSLINGLLPIDALCQVVQLKMYLAHLGLYDAVEAALTGGLTDPATIVWTTGGPVSLRSPLCPIVKTVAGLADDVALALFLASAATYPI